MNKNEAALYIATLFYCGLYAHEHVSEAQPLLDRINAIGKNEFSSGTISGRMWNAVSNDLANVEIRTANFRLRRQPET